MDLGPVDSESGTPVSGRCIIRLRLNQLLPSRYVRSGYQTTRVSEGGWETV